MFSGEDILEMLVGANEIAESANELFISGEGLSKAGTELLAAQLANMSIGDIEAMLQANKVDPLLIRKLFLDFIDLARALVSIHHVITSEDFTLTTNLQQKL